MIKQGVVEPDPLPSEAAIAAPAAQKPVQSAAAPAATTGKAGAAVTGARPYPQGYHTRPPRQVVPAKSGPVLPPTARPLGVPMQRRPATPNVFPVSGYGNRRRAKQIVAAQKRSTPSAVPNRKPEIIGQTAPKELINALPPEAVAAAQIPVGSDADAKS